MASFSTTFTQADGVAAGFTSIAGGNLQVVSNQAVAEFSFTTCSFYANQVCDTAVHEITADVNTPAAQQFEALTLCSTSAASTGYWFQRYTFGGGFQVTRNGSFWAGGTSASAIGSFTYHAYIDNTVGSGVDVVLTQDGTEVFRTNDATPLTGLYCAGLLQNSSSGQTMDNWSNGDVGGGGGGAVIRRQPTRRSYYLMGR